MFLGNYLISGGAETVLVLWQLSTGKQQHLPHLTAAIENIVVSPTGASYAITLANNSIIVLSTTELEAKMNIVGVQSRRVDKEQFPRTSTPNNYSIDLFSTVPMVVDPKNPSHVLFSVPSSQPRQEITGFRPEPYLQTFDIATQHAVWKQALTRNNATDPNMAPDGRPIEEPNVKFIQISIDGKWLATVDEWVPPRDDLAYLDEGITQFNQEERMFRREIFLKFWQWDEKNEQWVLGSRLDAPHYYESIGAGARILDLVSDPSGTGFATVGEDRSLRIWRPKTRTRGGVTVHGADKAEGLITWSPYRTVDLSCSLDVLETGQADAISHIPRYAKLAFSEDGSVLAAGVSDADSGVIHIVDTSTGSIRRSITELDVTKLSCLGILGRHMIVVSRSIVVWDLVTDEVVYYISDGAWNIDRFDKTPGARLAINAEGGTFAVALPHFEVNHGSKFREAQRLMRASTTVGVFNPSHSKAISESKSPNFILSLVPEKNGKGYIALDTSTSFTLLSPDSSLLQLPTPPPENLPQPLLAGALKEESDVEDEEIDRLEQDLATLTAEDGLLYSENDKPVVRPEQLQVVFDAGPSHALPPVKDLFNAVVGLYARKPRAVGAA
jgi:NET1-associated nuclear protein 1 (U3 small nucleolar RNA-associated protein 17)